MSVEQNKVIIRAMLDHINQGDWNALREHPGEVNEIPMYMALREAASNIQGTILLQLGEGEWVASRIVLKGKQTGEFMGMPPTGKDFEYEVITLHKVVSGKIVELRGVADVLTMMRQLGGMPPALLNRS